MEFQITQRVYSLVQSLPCYNYLTPGRELPKNGIYIFFEQGEHVELGGHLVDRIVRIGTHKSDGRFPDRIRQHYGRKSSLNGNKNGSVFRKHVGGALLRREDLADPRLKDWLTQDGPSFREVEEQVSQVLRDNFTFVCFQVDAQADRLCLERALIAQLAQFPVVTPSRDWLGLHAGSEKIRQSGLWNTQQVDAAPMTEEEFDRLKELVTATMAQVAK